MNELQRRITELAAAGEKVEAIQLLRAATGLGLAEAKAAIEGLARGAALPAIPAKLSEQGPEALPAEVRAALERGERVDAIRLLREATGLGLKESKEWLDRVSPPLAGRRGCLPVLLLAALGAHQLMN
jgi:ribosomal protein L7/L12